METNPLLAKIRPIHVGSTIPNTNTRINSMVIMATARTERAMHARDDCLLSSVTVMAAGTSSLCTVFCMLLVCVRVILRALQIKYVCNVDVSVCSLL